MGNAPDSLGALNYPEHGKGLYRGAAGRRADSRSATSGLMASR